MSTQITYYNHLLVVTLKSAYQGKFTELNILSRLGAKLELQDEIEHVKNILSRIEEWQSNLKQGILLFSDNLDNVDIHGAQEAYQYLEYLIHDTQELAPRLKRILASQEPHQHIEDVITCVASFGRYAYTLDNFLGEQKNYLLSHKQEPGPHFVDMQEAMQHELEMVQNFMDGTENIEDMTGRFYETLKLYCRILPGFFRASSHECKVLMTGPRSPFSFKDANFLKVEAEEWEKGNFSATEAGYWRAYEINAEEARQWIDLKVSQPLEAARWVTAGFTPLTGKPWLHVLFTPPLALVWTLAGYRPREAALFVRKGVYTPDHVPEEQEAGMILAESLQELVDIEKERRGRKN